MEKTDRAKSGKIKKGNGRGNHTREGNIMDFKYSLP